MKALHRSAWYCIRLTHWFILLSERKQNKLCHYAKHKPKENVLKKTTPSTCLPSPTPIWAHPRPSNLHWSQDTWRADVSCGTAQTSSEGPRSRNSGEKRWTPSEKSHVNGKTIDFGRMVCTAVRWISNRTSNPSSSEGSRKIENCCLGREQKSVFQNLPMHWNHD